MDPSVEHQVVRRSLAEDVKHPAYQNQIQDDTSLAGTFHPETGTLVSYMHQETCLSRLRASSLRSTLKAPGVPSSVTNRFPDVL